MIDDFIKLFTGLKENFGQIKLQAKVEFDKERNKIKPEYIWSKQPSRSNRGGRRSPKNGLRRS